MRSPLSEMYMASSSVALRQFQPSAANSMVLRAAMCCNSDLSDQMRLLMRLEYSVLMGMGTTDTSLSKEMRVGVVGTEVLFPSRLAE